MRSFGRKGKVQTNYGANSLTKDASGKFWQPQQILEAMDRDPFGRQCLVDHFESIREESERHLRDLRCPVLQLYTAVQVRDLVGHRSLEWPLHPLCHILGNQSGSNKKDASYTSAQ